MYVQNHLGCLSAYLCVAWRLVLRGSVDQLRSPGSIGRSPGRSDTVALVDAASTASNAASNGSRLRSIYQLLRS